MSCKKISNNKYRIVVEMGYDILGKRMRKIETFSGSFEEAKQREITLMKEYYHKGKKTNLNSLSFKEYSELYMREYCLNNVSKRSYFDNEYMLSEIIPYIGNVKLCDIDARLLDSMYNKLKVGKRVKIKSSETMLHYYRLINSMMRQAVKWDLIESNPNEKTHRPKKEKKNVECFYYAELETMMESLVDAPIRDKLLFVLALVTGCRRGELAAIRYSDIDLDNKTIVIDNSLKVVKGVVDETNAKNCSSVRVVHITDNCIKLLLEYKEYQDSIRIKQGDKWVDEDRVFTGKNGKYLHPDTMTKIISKMIKKYNLKKVTLHGLRHTNATIRNEKGQDLKTISTSLGHSSITTAADIYMAVSSEQLSEAVQIFDVLVEKTMAPKIGTKDLIN